MTKVQNIIYGMILGLCGVCTTSYAEVLTCPFTDTFQVRVPMPAKIINSPHTTGNLRYTQENDTVFNLSCSDNNVGDSGDLFVDVGVDDANVCSLTIHDGPFVSNPYVTNIDCKGKMRFNGVEHVMGTYSYTLKLNIQDLR